LKIKYKKILSCVTETVSCASLKKDSRDRPVPSSVIRRTSWLIGYVFHMHRSAVKIAILASEADGRYAADSRSSCHFPYRWIPALMTSSCVVHPACDISMAGIRSILSIFLLLAYF